MTPKPNIFPEKEDLRKAFPEVCKWFQRQDAEARLEVESRGRRFIRTGLSPCDDCSLCPQGHH